MSYFRIFEEVSEVMMFLYFLDKLLLQPNVLIFGLGQFFPVLRKYKNSLFTHPQKNVKLKSILLFFYQTLMSTNIKNIKINNQSKSKTSKVSAELFHKIFKG